MNRLLSFVIGVVLLGLIALFLNWAMTAFGAPPLLQNVVWVLFGLLVLLAVVGLFGYGPLTGPWKSGP